MVYKKNIEQYVNTSQWREWMAQVGQNRILSYIFTGWFDEIDDLRATFTEFDQNGKMLLQYCIRKNEPASIFIEHNSIVSWLSMDVYTKFTFKYA
jgi:hypothetical protein